MSSLPPVIPSTPRPGLAVASLVTGLLAFFSSVFLVGALFGVAGLVLGVAHLAGRQHRNGLAWTGILLSAIGLGASVGFGLVYYPAIKKHSELARQEEQHTLNVL